MTCPIGGWLETEVVFIILQHGSHGTFDDWKAMERAITAAMPSTPSRAVVVWGSNVNGNRGTDIGVRACGMRLATVMTLELRAVITRYPLATVRVSAVGHSMGGLILRQALAEVVVEPDLASVDWVAYITLATPHLGCQGLPPHVRFFGWLAGLSYSRAYADMLMNSKDLPGLCDAPLLHALRKFRHRHLYANIADHLVPFPTASLLLQDARSVLSSQTVVPGHPHVLTPLTLNPLEAQEPHDVVTKHFSGDGKTVAGMHRAIRAVGEWTLHPVHFTETFCVAHSAIIQHSSRAVALSAAGTDVVLHVASMLSSFY